LIHLKAISLRQLQIIKKYSDREDVQESGRCDGASPVNTAKFSGPVQEVAKILLERRINAVPVVDDNGKLVGLVSDPAST
jgi:CBS domain-containing protein